MKRISFYFLLICMLPACKDTIDVGSECMQARIEDFKTETYAQSIIRIDRPEGHLYWFIDQYADIGEQVLSEDCEVFCITDLEGFTNSLCDGSIFSFPKTVIWEK